MSGYITSQSSAEPDKASREVDEDLMTIDEESIVDSQVRACRCDLWNRELLSRFVEI
jgi:hypothetical protein